VRCGAGVVIADQRQHWRAAGRDARGGGIAKRIVAVSHIDKGQQYGGVVGEEIREMRLVGLATSEHTGATRVLCGRWVSLQVAS